MVVRFLGFLDQRLPRIHSQRRRSEENYWLLNISKNFKIEIYYESLQAYKVGESYNEIPCSDYLASILKDRLLFLMTLLLSDAWKGSVQVC